MNGDLQNVLVWRQAIDLADRVSRVAESLPDCERFVLNEQMRDAALSIPSNIAEGKGRAVARQYRQFVRYARGSTYELQSHIVFAEKRGYFSAELADTLIGESDEILKGLNALLRYLNRRAKLPPIPDTQYPSAKSAPETPSPSASAPPPSPASASTPP